MKLELFSTVLLLTLPGNLTANGPAQQAQERMNRSGCVTRQDNSEIEKKRETFLRSLKNGKMQAPGEVIEDVLLPRRARVL
jgi:hypothetical protein